MPIKYSQIQNIFRSFNLFTGTNSQIAKALRRQQPITVVQFIVIDDI